MFFQSTVSRLEKTLDLSLNHLDQSLAASNIDWEMKFPSFSPYTPIHVQVESVDEWFESLLIHDGTHSLPSDNMAELVHNMHIPWNF